MLDQAVSLAGAAMILFAYLANQRGWMGPENRAYSLLNVAGASLLLWIAVVDGRWGFIVLEGAWAMISLFALVRPPVPSLPEALGDRRPT